MAADCCTNPSFTRDPRSHKKYCKIHFSQFIENRVQRTISQYKLFTRDERIGIGYSGGKDSNVLLFILLKLQTRFNSTNLVALTVDEGITGYRESCIQLTQKVTKDNQIEHWIMSFEELFGVTLDEVVQKSQQFSSRLSPCAYCGILRRRALNVLAQQANVSKIATGHNLDDEAQSILMNILRGDARKFVRLSREPTQNFSQMIPRIRPLVKISEPEIVLYAQANDLEYHSIPCPYAASAMRNDIRTFLSLMETKRPSTLMNVVHAHDALRQYFPQKTNVSPPFRCDSCGEIASAEKCPVCELLSKLGIKTDTD